jgi:DNA-binding GntR family transcriptional regulator
MTIRRDSVISQAVQEIRRYIEAQRLSPGEALPPETRLSQMLGISRNSLREALRVLHGLGHVEKIAGRGNVVTAVLSKKRKSTSTSIAKKRVSLLKRRKSTATITFLKSLTAQRMGDAFMWTSMFLGVSVALILTYLWLGTS